MVTSDFAEAIFRMSGILDEIVSPGREVFNISLDASVVETLAKGKDIGFKPLSLTAGP
jgi:hypothetical protein